MDKNIQINQLNLREIISGIFRQKKFIIISIPVIIIGTYVYLILQTPQYEATVKMHVVGRAQIAADFYSELGSAGIHATQMAIARSHIVLKRAVNALRLDRRPLDYEKNFSNPLKFHLIDYRVKTISRYLEQFTPERQRAELINLAIGNLDDNLKMESVPGTDLFTITVKDFSIDEAKKIANVVSRSYMIFDQQQQLAELNQRYGMQHPSVLQLRDNIFAMTEKLSGEQLPELEAIGTASVKVIEQAISGNQPIGKPKIQIFLIAIAASVCVGIGLAIVWDVFMDQTFKSPVEVAKFTGLPLLGSSPIKKYRDSILIRNDSINLTKSEIRYSDFIDDLADQLYIYMKVNNHKTILVTSAFPKGGSSTICANLGLNFSNGMNLKTLLVDANFRNPSLHKLFNIKEGQGLSNMLEESKLIEYHAMILDSVNLHQTPEYDFPEKTEIIQPQYPLYDSELFKRTNEIINHVDSRLDLLQSGNSSMTPFTLFNDMKTDAIFKIAKSIYDVVIIDCTNLKEFKDAGNLSSYADGVVLVVNDGMEKRQIVMNSISYLKQKKANPAGVILNRRRFPIPGIIYKWL